jgi:hypothetical protein
MVDAIGGGSASVPVAVAPAACCEKSDGATADACVRCRQPVCRNCQRFVNGKKSCLACLRKILAEVEGQRAKAAQTVPAAVGGLVAAALCGAAWTAMVVVTKMEIGYAAVGVGFAAGYGVLWGAGKKKSSQLQLVAVACALLGLVLGKYLTLAYLLKHLGKVGAEVSYFDPRLLGAFVQALPQLLSPFDALWAFIALRISWRVTRPVDLHVTRTPVSG